MKKPTPSLSIKILEEDKIYTHFNPSSYLMGLNEAFPTTPEIIQTAAHHKLSISMHQSEPLLYFTPLMLPEFWWLEYHVIYDLLKVGIQENEYLYIT